MCIRDRLQTMHCALPEFWHLPEYRRPPLGFLLGLPVPPPCLLYTSDAADERSSVDLGGRRIIKKKKKINTNCAQSIVSNTRVDHDRQ